MAHLWIPADDAAWAILELDARPYDLDRSPPSPVSEEQLAPDDIPSRRRRQVWIVPAGDRAGGRWALVAGPHRRVWVNGVWLDLGLRLLEDRDQIRLDNGRSCYYSSEARARRTRYAGDGRAVQCPRCKQEITPGSIAVGCPHCGVWHHESEERPCWSDFPTCTHCGRQTTLEDAPFTWAPEGI